jgi:predicted RNA-binding protein associated with RNAse of E/G family
MNLSKKAKEILETKFYTFKEKEYEIIKIIRFKNVSDDLWIEIIEYSPLYKIEDYSGTFARTLDNFLDKFKKTI